MDKSAFRRASSVMLATSVSLLGLIAAPAHAQATSPDASTTASGEIIVTATKRATLIQDVPFSINAQTSQDIARAHAQTLEDLSRNVAGLTIQNLGPGQSQVAIRGISSGQIVRDQPGVKEQVGVYLDESVISLSLFTPDLDLFDLSRVETLRGPQGTLFGSGSEGGTIRYITNQPKFDRDRGLGRGGRQPHRRRQQWRRFQGRDQPAAGRHGGGARGRLLHALCRLYRRAAGRRQRQEERQ